MRLIATLLFAALLVFGIWSFVDSETFLLGPMPDGYSWWWPEYTSTFGGDIDFLFTFISWLILVFFVGTMGALIMFVFKYSKKREGKAVFSHGNHKLEMIWTGIPAALLLIIAFMQMTTWADIKFAGATAGKQLFAEVFASQFDWRFRYPGIDGRFGTADDIESVYEFVVPVDEDIVFNLRSHDVLHSFFVPVLRLKQDAVPGMTIPVWFNSMEEGTFDLICAELCGWGHYKMAGRITVVSRAEFDQWIVDKTAEKYSNGQENQ
ncbi:MAG: cytochrome c oxidase subunit II [Planctomycetota bacterium]|nr:MAG: cytochrome c oxidase subunit II [Planctomycetota bacterium]